MQFGVRIARLAIIRVASKIGGFIKWRRCLALSVRLRRFRCAGCGHAETGVSWQPYRRSTPELDQLRAHVSALLPYRVAAGLLEHLLPVETGKCPETLRGHTLKIGEQLRDAAAIKPPVGASAITIALGATFIRGGYDDERHLEVRVGNVETSAVAGRFSPP